MKSDHHPGSWAAALIAGREQGAPSSALIAPCIIEELWCGADTFGERSRLQAGLPAASLTPSRGSSANRQSAWE